MKDNLDENLIVVILKQGTFLSELMLTTKAIFYSKFHWCKV